MSKQFAVTAKMTAAGLEVPEAEDEWKQMQQYMLNEQITSISPARCMKVSIT